MLLGWMVELVDTHGGYEMLEILTRHRCNLYSFVVIFHKEFHLFAMFSGDLLCVFLDHLSAYLLQKRQWGRDTGDDKSLPVSYAVIVVRTVTTIGDADLCIAFLFLS